MFDLTSSKLLILGVVALIVVGPRELPFLLRTIGKYVGMIRRQANEFRAQFDEAMREAELDSIKKDLEKVARETENTIRDAQSMVERDIHAANTAVEHSIKPPVEVAPLEPVHEPVHSYDALNGLDVPNTTAAELPAPPEPDVTHHSKAAPTGPIAQTSAAHVTPVEVATAHELAKTGT